jgi:hypothetical protein
MDGWYDVQGELGCHKCLNSCFRCENNLECSECSLNKTNRVDNISKNRSCPCILGYYDDLLRMDCLSIKLKKLYKKNAQTNV